MPWSERQTAMLAEMGVRLWPATAAPALAAQPTTVVEPTTPPVLPAEEPRPPRRAVVPAAVAVATAALTAAPVDLRALDWAALRDAVAGCAACALHSGRTQTVFGAGHPHAHWMLVGEAPGEQEDLQGEPFVGRSGQLLDNMLRAVGLTRGNAEALAAPDADPARHVYIANTLKCRPPGNRNPRPEELARCEGFLIRQIELVRPRIIVAMGGFAVQSLLRSSEPVGRLRGRVHRYHGVPLVVTYHPAYLLRNPADKARAWDDLCLALDTVAMAAASVTVTAAVAPPRTPDSPG